MSTITLLSMKCVELQDSISEDEIEVRLNGSKVVGPIGVHKNETVTLNASRNFTGTVTVQLVELDSNSAEDDLGLHVVGAAIDSGTLLFDKANKATYTLSYRVT